MSKLTDGPNPWMPMTGVQDIRVLGKFAEELGECASAVARCLIQGIDETEPTTGVCNADWLEDEIADVLANITLVIAEYDLDFEYIQSRAEGKIEYLERWHQHDS